MRRLFIVFGFLLFSISRSFAMDGSDIRAFHDAVRIGDVEKVETMLKADPKLATSVGEFGFQPINLQDMYFEPKIFRLLLDAGADVNAANEDGITLLHIIADPEPVAVIIKAGGNLEARDRGGRTPLMINLAEPEREDVIEALVEAGADVNAKDKAGRTVLSMARERGDDDIVELLTDAGARD